MNVTVVVIVAGQLESGARDILRACGEDGSGSGRMAAVVCPQLLN